MYNLAQMVNKQITSFITIKKKGKIPPVAGCLWLYKKFSQLYCGNAMPRRGLMTDFIVQAQRKKLFFFFLHIGFFIWLIKTEFFLLLICVLTLQREWSRHVEQPLWHQSWWVVLRGRQWGDLNISSEKLQVIKHRYNGLRDYRKRQLCEKAGEW